MDAVRILGDLLGNRQFSRGRGSNILENIVRGAGRNAALPRAMPRQHAQAGPVNQSPLGGLIRAAVEGYVRGKQPRDSTLNRPGYRRGYGGSGYGGAGYGGAGYRNRPANRSYVRPGVRPLPRVPNPGDCRFPNDQAAANAQAQLLIRAMIYAARSDGRVDGRERKSIKQRIGRMTPEDRRWLDYEFDRPVDVRLFAREVPPGLEDEVYAISLTAIDLDTNREARYLHDLAHELGLNHEHVNYIHAQVGARPLF